MVYRLRGDMQRESACPGRHAACRRGQEPAGPAARTAQQQGCAPRAAGLRGPRRATRRWARSSASRSSAGRAGRVSADRL